MARPTKLKIFPILFSIIALSGIGWIFYDSFYGGVTGEHHNEVNAVLIGSKDAVFEPVLPDDPVAIPEDFKEHPEFQHEWWHFSPTYKTSKISTTGYSGAFSESPMTNVK
jgi:hypothetical protein